MAETGQTQQQEQKSQTTRVAAVEESEAPFEGVLAAATALVALQAGSATQPDADEVRALQRHSGNSAVMRLIAQRRASTSHDPEPSQHGPVHVQRSVTLGEQVLVNYEQCLLFVIRRRLRLFGERQDFAADQAPAPEGLEPAISASGGLVTYLQSASDPDAEIDGLTARSMRDWYPLYLRAFNACQASKARIAAARIRAAEQRAAQLRTSIDERLIPRLRERQRSAFRADDSNALLGIADTLATALDTSLGCRGAIELLAGERRQLGALSRAALLARSEAPLANNRAAPVLNAAERLNQVYARFALLRAALTAMSGSTTEAEHGSAQVSAAVSAYGALGTVLGVSAGVSAYANLYLAPMVSTVLSAVSQLFATVSRSRNRRAIEAGRLNAVAWGVEPGGRPMFEFMLGVMRAGGPSGVPAPVPRSVAAYFVEHESEFEAGTGGGRRTDLPTRRAWTIFWETLDQQRIAPWIYRNRRDVWGMLYGDCAVPQE